MGKYDKLGQHLAAQVTDEVPMRFSDIERVIGAKLPPRAQLHRAWWSNNAANNVMTQVWLDAGFRSERVDIEGRTLVFKRVERATERQTKMSEPAKGVSDEAREFNPMLPDGEKKQGTSPLWGALKGTFTIEPGYDLTSPMYTDEEWAEIEKEMEEDWDMIERGMSGRTE